MNRRPQVLVVDDHTVLAENIAEILAGLAVDVTVVPSGQVALARCEKALFDLALVDVRLPDGSGTDLLPRLRAISPLMAVVLITGDASVETAIAAVKSGAFSYITKPFSPVDLLETARRALQQVALYREQERLRLELERSERTHREVVEAVPAFVLALDGTGQIALWNKHLEEATGFSRDEMVGQPGAEIIKGDGVRRLPLKGEGERLVRWERAAVPVPTSAGSWTYAVGVDVTQEQNMLRRTLRAERLAAVGTLAAGLAHEVRNPINSATLQLTVLSRRLERGDTAAPSLQPVVDIVQQELRRLERLVSEFLSFVQPRPLDLRPTPLADLCGSTLTLVQPEAEAAGITISMEMAPDLPPLSADPERLKQVLLNLFRNAVEAMPQGGQLTVRARSHGPHEVEMEVEDSGYGFADEAPIFDAFFTTKPQGTGLGLSIVHRIVTDHGGTLRVKSQPGNTCFTISLPVNPPG